MPAYWIAHVDVSDAATYAQYAKAATSAIAAHGGRFLARGGRSVTLEGKGRARNVVIEFPSLEAAEACYHSDAYQVALGFAHGVSVRDLVVVEGV
ncbi:DUF1330 domain-containing protein [Rhodobacteraceae bacterium DSL-40]|uniref:DUF1330 domain-containing protein n=1 Tax=Amaricoccus sp. B4 TaxID=3368557 RepID=UPI000DAEEB77